MVSKLRKFCRLGTTDRRLLVKALLLLWLFRIGLYLLPFRTVRRLAGIRPGPPEGRVRPRQFADEFGDTAARAVRQASRCVPGSALCLCQALTVGVLMKRAGLPAQVINGVSKQDGHRLAAHAWVESGGAVIIGGEKMMEFTALPVLNFEGELS